MSSSYSSSSAPPSTSSTSSSDEWCERAHFRTLDMGRIQTIIVAILICISALFISFDLAISDLYVGSIPQIFQEPENRYSVHPRRGFNLKFTVKDRVASLDNAADLKEYSNTFIENSNHHRDYSVPIDSYELEQYFDMKIIEPVEGSVVNNSIVKWRIFGAAVTTTGGASIPVSAGADGSQQQDKAHFRDVLFHITLNSLPVESPREMYTLPLGNPFLELGLDLAEYNLIDGGYELRVNMLLLSDNRWDSSNLGNITVSKKVTFFYINKKTLLEIESSSNSNNDSTDDGDGMQHRRGSNSNGNHINSEPLFSSPPSSKSSSGQFHSRQEADIGIPSSSSSSSSSSSTAAASQDGMDTAAVGNLDSTSPTSSRNDSRNDINAKSPRNSKLFTKLGEILKSKQRSSSIADAVSSDIPISINNNINTNSNLLNNINNPDLGSKSSEPHSLGASHISFPITSGGIGGGGGVVGGSTTNPSSVSTTKIITSFLFNSILDNNKQNGFGSSSADISISGGDIPPAATLERRQSSSSLSSSSSSSPSTTSSNANSQSDGAISKSLMESLELLDSKLKKRNLELGNDPTLLGAKFGDKKGVTSTRGNVFNELGISIDSSNSNSNSNSNKISEKSKHQTSQTLVASNENDNVAGEKVVIYQSHVSLTLTIPSSYLDSLYLVLEVEVDGVTTDVTQHIRNQVRPSGGLVPSPIRLNDAGGPSEQVELQLQDIQIGICKVAIITATSEFLTKTVIGKERIDLVRER